MDSAQITWYFCQGILGALLFYVVGHVSGMGSKYMEKFIKP